MTTQLWHKNKKITSGMARAFRFSLRRSNSDFALGSGGGGLRLVGLCDFFKGGLASGRGRSTATAVATARAFFEERKAHTKQKRAVEVAMDHSK
jgi:hypothetical protein